jgi:hypothetical protein
MAQGTKREGNPRPEGSPKGKREEGELSGSARLSTFEQIQLIARTDARAESGERHNRLFLMSWWSQYYNRPLKDPLLMSYTLEELAYEYYLVGERAKYREEQNSDLADKIEEEKFKEAEEWADQMEAEEEEAERIAAEKAAKKKKKQEETYDPLNDPNNLKWMEEEIAKNKELFGEDFGENLSLDFDEGE